MWICQYLFSHISEYQTSMYISVFLKYVFIFIYLLLTLFPVSQVSIKDDGPDVVIFLPTSHECCDYRYVVPCSVYLELGIKLRA